MSSPNCTSTSSPGIQAMPRGPDQSGGMARHCATDHLSATISSKICAADFDGTKPVPAEAVE